jgi:hypothetical protein
MKAAQERDVQHSWQVYIIDELCTSREKARVFVACDAFAEIAGGHGNSGRLVKQ